MNSHVSEHAILVLHFGGQSVSAMAGWRTGVWPRSNVDRPSACFHSTQACNVYCSAMDLGAPLLVVQQSSRFKKESLRSNGMLISKNRSRQAGSCCFRDCQSEQRFFLCPILALRYNLRTSRDHTGVFLRLSSLWCMPSTFCAKEGVSTLSTRTFCKMCASGHPPIPVRKSNENFMRRFKAVLVFVFATPRHHSSAISPMGAILPIGAISPPLWYLFLYLRTYHPFWPKTDADSQP